MAAYRRSFPASDRNSPRRRRGGSLDGGGRGRGNGILAHDHVGGRDEIVGRERGDGDPGEGGLVQGADQKFFCR